jgi:hypothetical protein
MPFRSTQCNSNLSTFFFSYEPELFPGLIYRMVKPRIVLLIFVSGKVVLTGTLLNNFIISSVRTIISCTTLQFYFKFIGVCACVHASACMCVFFIIIIIIMLTLHVLTFGHRQMHFLVLNCLVTQVKHKLSY